MVAHGASLFSALCVMVALCTCSVNSRWRNIYVDNENGNDTEWCLTSNSIFSPCATLQHAVSGLRNYYKILLSQGTHSIDQTINVGALHRISITGMNSDSDMPTIFL